MGYQTYCNKHTPIPSQHHFQLNWKCLSWELLPPPVGTELGMLREQSSQSRLQTEHLVTLLSRHLSKSLTPSSQSVRTVQQPSELCLWWTSWNHISINLSFSFCLSEHPKTTWGAPLCRVLGILHTHLELSTTSRPKADASHARFCSWICYLRQAERDLPFFQTPQKGQKSLTVNCFYFILSCIICNCL